VRQINVANSLAVLRLWEADLGFTGSAGTAVITMDKAALFTDGRYFNQAAKQLDDNWQLMKVGLIKVPTWQEWISDLSQEGKTIGVDPAVITVGASILEVNVDGARDLKRKLKAAGKGKLIGVETNLVDEVWSSSRPNRPQNPVFVLPDKFTGMSLDIANPGKPFQDKISELRKELTEKKTSGMVVSMLDEVAWLFNLRGSDIDYNPVFFAYAVVTHDSTTLFIDENKLTAEVREHLQDVQIAPYENVFGHIKTLGEVIDGDKTTGKIFVSNKCSWALTLSLGENKVTEGTPDSQRRQ
jgi:Xaa-Pro aminopeptidase